MQVVNRMAAQGDFIIMRIDNIPDNLEPLKDVNGQYIIAHSETAHNHLMERTHVDAYVAENVKEVDLYEMFLNVKEPTEIVHHRSFDTHETLLVPPGNYKVRRQREYTPEGFRKAAD